MLGAGTRTGAGTEVDGTSRIGRARQSVHRPRGVHGRQGFRPGQRRHARGSGSTAQANGIGLAASRFASRRCRCWAIRSTVLCTRSAVQPRPTWCLAASGTGAAAHVQSSGQGQPRRGGGRVGAKAEVLLGTGSLQMPGRATANSVPLDATQVRNSELVCIWQRSTWHHVHWRLGPGQRAHGRAIQPGRHPHSANRQPR